MRILFFGDMAATGFGSVTTDLGRQMLEQGADVRFLSQNDTGEDLPEPFRSRTVDLLSLPFAINQMTGDAGTIGAPDGIPALLNGTSKTKLHSGEPYGDWTPEVCLVLGDFHAARHIIGRFLEDFRRVPTFHYVPIEGVGLPPAWAEMWRVAAPIAMSKFGAEQIRRATGIAPPLVYHGVDTTVFRPVTKAKPLVVSQPSVIVDSQEKCKQAWVGWLMEQNRVNQIPRKWLLRTDRHMPRKRYNSLIRSVAPALARHPDWALILHCHPADQGGYLPDTISKLPKELRGQVLLTDASGIPRDLLAVLYNAADLYVSNSAEGFGLTIAEAIACGVPAVGINYSAVPEVIGPAGVTVSEGALLDNEYDHFWFAVDEDKFGAAVEHLMTHQTKRQDLGRQGPKHVSSMFRWDTAATDFLSIFHSTVSARSAA
jgi:glycosyltransferase involved in cell wall biosynthesis